MEIFCAQTPDSVPLIFVVGGGYNDNGNITAYGTPAHTRKNNLTVIAGEIQIEQDDVRTGNLAGIDLIDVADHRFAVSMACKRRFDPVVSQCFTNQEYIGYIVLDENYVELTGRVFMSGSLLRGG
jgi:hypothetical protein